MIEKLPLPSMQPTREIIRIVKADAVSFGGIDAENTLLPLSVLPVEDDIYQEKVKTTGKSYMDVAIDG
jgi:hypothetical protein